MTAMYLVEPRHGHYACFVDLLSRAGPLLQAKQLIYQMPSHQKRKKRKKREVIPTFSLLQNGYSPVEIRGISGYPEAL
ncbi:hypothetical protein RHMOL_Rhmol10G0251500 [Rhododendron molle]|uniref:Uncharacterized protein n=1 Tax=Rhododendron molle TaxID=49168 RepID=A0ACC0M788_RHOML|nr:hypothetical protein RHMOL_Rhmol10G0251500 [Rhododendron molle]